MNRSCRTYSGGYRRLLALVLLALVFYGAETKTSAQGSNRAAFRFESLTQNSLGVWEGEKPVLVYNHGPITNVNAPTAQSHSAYIHPIYGLDGEVITGDFPADHVYHRGLYWAWPHVQINGQEFDLWSLRGIRIGFERWLARAIDDDLATLGVENGWFVGQKKVMREEARLRVHRAEGDSRSIDLDLSWTPTVEPVTLWGAPGKSYGGLTLRFGKRSKTIVTVPSGRASEDLLMMKLPWADLSGDLGAGGMSGAAVFVNPQHPDFLPEWMTREYGVLAVGWPGVKAQTLEPGKTITCRYRIWVHRGNPAAAEIQKAYEAVTAGALKR